MSDTTPMAEDNIVSRISEVHTLMRIINPHTKPVPLLSVDVRDKLLLLINEYNNLMSALLENYSSYCA